MSHNCKIVFSVKLFHSVNILIFLSVKNGTPSHFEEIKVSTSDISKKDLTDGTSKER